MTDALSKIRNQIMWNRLIAVVEEQGQTLMRTAFSPIVRECGDLSACVFDLKGRMMAQAVTGTPGHVNSMNNAVGHFMRHFPLQTMREGDIYMTNDPWMGTGHLNDWVLMTPCFHKGKLVATFLCTAHITDIGGLSSGADGTDVFMEGLSIPMTKLADQGKINETLVEMIKANTRLPTDNEGDLYSLIACNDIGCRRLVEMMREFSLDDLEELADAICDNSQAAVLAEIRKLPQGSWRSSMTIDGFENPVGFVAEMTVSEDGIHVDYDGTSPASRYGINVPFGYTLAYTGFGISCVVSPNIPNNGGSLAPITASAPEGCILNAVSPAPVSARHVIGQMLPDVVFGCMRQIAPDRVPAEGTSSLWTLNLKGRRAGDNAGQRIFSIKQVTTGGAGARPMKDGLSATAYPSGVMGTPIEITESEAPLIFWRKEYRPDSGGPGKYRGGHGQIIEIENREGVGFDINAAHDRIVHAPRGNAGGSDGANGYLGIAEGDAIGSKGRQPIPAGGRLVVHSPGGGGIGDPTERDPNAVAADVRDGLVSPDAAKRDYGLNVEA